MTSPANRTRTSRADSTRTLPAKPTVSSTVNRTRISRARPTPSGSSLRSNPCAGFARGPGHDRFAVRHERHRGLHRLRRNDPRAACRRGVRVGALIFGGLPGSAPAGSAQEEQPLIHPGSWKTRSASSRPAGRASVAADPLAAQVSNEHLANAGHDLDDRHGARDPQST